MALYVLDTGSTFDRPIEKGQWAVSDIPGQGKEIVEKWIKEKLDKLMSELRYAELDNERGPHKIENIRALAEDFNIEISVDVMIKKKSKKRKAAKTDGGRKAQR